MRSFLPNLVPTDPLALSSGAGARMALAGLVLAALWGAVAWAFAL